MSLSDLLYGNTPPRKPDEDPKDLIWKKHNEYYVAARRYRLLYYTTRLVAGLCAGILPFVISTAPAVAISLSVAIVVATVIDTVFGPRERWRAFSRATDLLSIAELKNQGKYDDIAESLTIILATEDQGTIELLALDDVIQKAKQSAETAPTVRARESAPPKRDRRIQEALGLDPSRKSDSEDQ